MIKLWQLMIVLGHINYLNCIPVHGAILLGKVPFAGRIVTSNPAQLNRMLAEGLVDISPSSSVELMRGHRILPGLSISGKEDVKSILLFLRKPLEETRDGTFYVSSHSATSVMLLRVLFQEFYRVGGGFEVFDPDASSLEQLPETAEGALFIGDYALRLGKSVFERPDPRFPHCYDLAALWHGRTGLPFTFALWQVRDGSADRSGIMDTLRALRESYGYFIENSGALAETFSAQYQMSSGEIADYWKHLSFDLGDRNIESLRLFFSLCRKHGLMRGVPDIRIYE